MVKLDRSTRLSLYTYRIAAPFSLSSFSASARRATSAHEQTHISPHIERARTRTPLPTVLAPRERFERDRPGPGLTYLDPPVSSASVLSDDSDLSFGP